MSLDDKGDIVFREIGMAVHVDDDSVVNPLFSP